MKKKKKEKTTLSRTQLQVRAVQNFKTTPTA
jgi:hypothetical protein